MRAFLAGASLTVLAILAISDGPRQFFAPVPAAPAYILAPAPGQQVYGNQQEVPQFIQPFRSAQQARVATLTVSGEETIAPKNISPEAPEWLQEVQELLILVLRIG